MQFDQFQLNLGMKSSYPSRIFRFSVAVRHLTTVIMDPFGAYIWTGPTGHLCRVGPRPIRQFLSVLFSPLGKLAGRAIYFADVFSLFKKKISGRLRSPTGSEANGPIFTKISGMVDRLSLIHISEPTRPY